MQDENTYSKKILFLTIGVTVSIINSDFTGESCSARHIFDYEKVLMQVIIKIATVSFPFSVKSLVSLYL